MIDRRPGNLGVRKRTPSANRRMITMPRTGDLTEGHLQGDVAREFNVSTQEDTQLSR